MIQVLKIFFANFVKIELILPPLTLLTLTLLNLLTLTFLNLLILLTLLKFERVTKRVLRIAQACFTEKTQVLPSLYRKDSNCTSTSINVFSQTIA